MATGFPTGLYYQFGERLKEEVAKDGVNLVVKSTGGTIDNLGLLNDPKSGVNFAMVQGGVADVNKYPSLVSIAGMFYELIKHASNRNQTGILINISNTTLHHRKIDARFWIIQ